MTTPPSGDRPLTRTHFRMWTVLGALVVAVFGAVVVVTREPGGGLDRMWILTFLALAGSWIWGFLALHTRVRSEPGDRSWARTVGLCLLMSGGATAMALLLLSCDSEGRGDEAEVVNSNSAGVTLVQNPGTLGLDLMGVSGMDASRLLFHLAAADHRYPVSMEMLDTRGPGIAVQELPER